MLRDRFTRKERFWLLVCTLTALIILILFVPVIKLIQHLSANNNAQNGSLEPVAVSSLDKSNETRLIFLQQKSQNQSNSGAATDLWQKLYDKVSNVKVVSNNGTVYSGELVEKMMTYEEAEMLCQSKGARLPWFEMESSDLELSGPVWIESSVDMSKRMINASEKISLETMDLLMNKWLAENSQLILISYNFAYDLNTDLCLLPIRKNGLRKLFVCKNETFDEQNRMIVFLDNSIHCELEKITLELYNQYQPCNERKRDETWSLREGELRESGFAREYSGWTLFDDYEQSGIPICNYTSKGHLAQQKELMIYTSRNAHVLCVFEE